MGYTYSQFAGNPTNAKQDQDNSVFGSHNRFEVRNLI